MESNLQTCEVHGMMDFTQYLGVHHGRLNFLCRKYTQAADKRQQEMELQYTTAETHDLSAELAKFFRNRLTVAQRAALRRAVSTAEGWRGALVGNPELLEEFDEFIEVAKDALKALGIRPE